MQIDSYQAFLKNGLNAAFNFIFPIKSFSGNAQLEYVSCNLGNVIFSVRECKLRGLTYSVPLRINTRLILFDKESSQNNKTNNSVFSIYAE